MSNKNKLLVIIPSATYGKRMKSYGPKCLIKVKNKPILRWQLDQLNQHLQPDKVIVLGGHKADDIQILFSKEVLVVNNLLYLSKNINYSFSLCNKHIQKYQKLLIIYGDLIFNHDTLSNLDLSSSFVIINNNKTIEKKTIGTNVIDGYIKYFSYGLPNKWCQISFLTGFELQCFMKLLANEKYHNMYDFEIFNDIIDMGGRIRALESTTMKIVEIDRSSDIARAGKII